MQKFNFRKILSGGKSKSLSLGELAKAFSGESGSWNAGAHLQQYHKSLYVYAAVNAIAKKVAAIDMRLFKIKDKFGDSEEELVHPILDLLAKPNPFQTASEFLKCSWINKKLAGEAFWWKVRNKKGQVVELWNLRPDLVTVVSDPKLYIKAYRFARLDGMTQDFAPEDIIHFKDPDPLNSFRGLSPVAVSKNRILTEYEATLFQKNFFLNNARPDALLLTEESLDEDQRAQMVSSWEEKHQGRSNNSKVGLLEGGLKYQQISISQREMDYIESMKFTRDDILVAFGVPKSIVTTDDINYANADAGIRMFLSETIVPEMKHLVEVCNEMLVVTDFGAEYYLDFIDPTPADRTTQRADSIAGFGRWLTANEIRTSYNLPDIEGGDVIATLVNPMGLPTTEAAKGMNISNRTRLMNARRQKTIKILQSRPMLVKRFEILAFVMKGIDGITKDLSTKLKVKSKVVKSMSKKGLKDKKTVEYVSILSDKALRQTYYDVMNDRIEKKAKNFEKELVVYFKTQEKRVTAELKKIKKEKDIAKKKILIGEVLSKADEVKALVSVSIPYLIDFALEGGEDAAKLTSETFVMSEALKAAVNKRARFFADAATDTTFQKLSDSLTEGIDAGEGINQLSERVSAIYEEATTSRADLIARTETTNANNEGALAQFEDSDVVKGKEWIATLDDRTRDEHVTLDGEIVAKDGVFSNGLQFPSEPNCRCQIAPTLSSDNN